METEIVSWLRWGRTNAPRSLARALTYCVRRSRKCYHTALNEHCTRDDAATYSRTHTTILQQLPAQELHTIIRTLIHAQRAASSVMCAIYVLKWLMQLLLLNGTHSLKSGTRAALHAQPERGTATGNRCLLNGANAERAKTQEAKSQDARVHVRSTVAASTQNGTVQNAVRRRISYYCIQRASTTCLTVVQACAPAVQ